MPGFQDYLALINNAPNPLESFLGGQDQARARQASINQQAFQQQQQQAAIAQAQVKAKAMQEAMDKGTPEAYRNYQLADPDHGTAISAALSSLTDEQRRAELKHAASVDGFLQANKPEMAIAEVRKRRDADEAAGLDTADDDALIGLIQSDLPAARAHSGIMMAAATGPQAFAPTLNAANANTKLPGEVAQAAAALAKTQAETDQIKNPRPSYEMAPNPVGGAPFVLDKTTGKVTGGGSDASGPLGNNGALGGFVDTLVGTEKGASPDAKNPRSSATGDGQFIQSTWIPLITRLHPELVQGKTPQQILDLRKDPALSREATGAYAQDNAQTLQGAGLPVNGTTLAMAHKLGPEGAQAVMAANPAAPLSTVLPKQVIDANPQLKGLTAGAYAQGLMKKFGTAPLDVSPGDVNATGDDYLKTLPPARARMIKAIADGDATVPTRNPGLALQIKQQVLQYDPTASDQTLQTRQATRKDFTSGKSATAISAATTVAGHLHDIEGQIDDLHNSSFLPGLVNKAKNAIGRETSPKAQAAQAKFLTTANTLAQELTKFYRVTGGSEADVEAFRKRLDLADSPDALHAVAQDIAQNMQGKLQSLQEQYANGMGQTNAQAPIPAGTITMLGRIAGGAQQQAPKTAVDAQGRRIAWDPASRQWKPVN